MVVVLNKTKRMLKNLSKQSCYDNKIPVLLNGEVIQKILTSHIFLQ